MRSIINILKTSVLALMLVSCSGTNEPQIKNLVIKTDKNEIIADGLEKFTITVLYGDEDVTKSDNLSIHLIKDENKTVLPAGNDTFSTYEPGIYELSASYKDGYQTAYTTENAKVRILDAMTAYTMSGYRQKMLAMCFTSIWCQYCPALHQAIKEVQKEMPGRIVPMAVHEDILGPDPFATGIALRSRFYDRVNTGEGSGLPLFSMNLRKSSQHITNEKLKIVSEIEKQSKEHPVFCGISVESSYVQATDASLKVDVKAGFKADIPGYYNCHIFLVEDNLMMEQFGDQSYIHDNVLRHVNADNLFGIKLNQGKPLSVGEEYKIEKTIDMSGFYNPKNMRVIVSMLYSADGGQTFECNNTVECQLEGSVDYLYEN